MNTSISSLVGVLCSLLVTAVFAQPAPLVVEDIETLTASVESIDHSKRLVELRSGNRKTTVQIPQTVRNLDQVKVGDQLVVKYQQGVAAQFRKKGESTTAGLVDVTSDSTRAAPGAKPGASVANTVTTTVTIESVDRANNSVTFVGPLAMSRTVEVKDPKAQEFIGSLKKGDEVELTYTEALAIMIEQKK